MDIFVGIDPSMNSTGICVRAKEGDELIKEHYYIIKPNKLTRKEKEAEQEILDFDYVLYDKIDLKIYENMNHFQEYWKTVNILNIVDKIKYCVYEGLPQHYEKIHIVQEGISYGSSIRTKSVFDLAGLNYLIRNSFINKDNVDLTIASPTEIKKFTTGKGNADKEMIVKLFSSTKPELMKLPKVDDLADAYYMAKYAENIYNENEESNN